MKEEETVSYEAMTKQELLVMAKWHEAKAEAYWQVIMRLTEGDQVHNISWDAKDLDPAPGKERG